MNDNANSVKLKGRNNKGEPRQIFADRVATLDDASFVKQTETIIWLSAYANNNSRSDYHWQADACYDEARRRGKPELYSKAHKRAENA